MRYFAPKCSRFGDLEDDMNLAEDYLKHCVAAVLKRCPADVDFFNLQKDSKVDIACVGILAGSIRVICRVGTRSFVVCDWRRVTRPSWKKSSDRRSSA